MKGGFPTFKNYYEAINSGDSEVIEEIVPALVAGAGRLAVGAARGAKAAVTSLGKGLGKAVKPVKNVASKIGKGLNDVNNIATVASIAGDAAEDEATETPVKAPSVPIQHIKQQADATVDSIFTNIPPEQMPQVVQHLKNKLMNVQSAK